MTTGRVYYLNKGAGDTSFGAIRKLQRQYQLSKVGHCGTLDKFAEGLLIVLSQSATKLAGVITGLDKQYCAEIAFGTETDTLDPEGRVVASRAVPSEDAIRQGLALWLDEIAQQNGVLQQVPPAFSALHSQGKRLYQRALAGEDLSALPSRQVALYACQLLSWQAPLLRVQLHCSKGFYVRSFARDLARRCGAVAHLHTLVRTAIADISLSEAGKLGQEVPSHDLASLLLRLHQRLALRVCQTGKDLYPSGEIPPADWRELRRGQIPKEIVQSIVRETAQKTVANCESAEFAEFAIVHRQQLLGLFRCPRWPKQSGQSPKIPKIPKIPKVRFWHNFCAEHQEAVRS